MGSRDNGLITRPLKAVMLERLMDCGTWMDRHALAANASLCAMAIDDALADLVIEGKAEYREHVGYRLAGTPVARRAVRMLQREKVSRAVYSQQVGKEYRVGVAERREGADALGVVMYELALPMPAPGPKAAQQHLAQVQALCDFTGGKWDV